MTDLPFVDEVVRLTFEEMAFLDIASGLGPRAEPTPEEGPVLYLSYTHPAMGAFALYLPKEIKFEVAEAIYGEEWRALSATQLDDSLLDLMKVLAGRVLTNRFGNGSPYKMGLPTVLYDPPESLPGSIRTDFPFHVDEKTFTLVWYEVPV